MLPLLTLHIIFLVFWAASLIYLPALIVGSLVKDNLAEEPAAQADSLSRFVFTRISTPAALAAIVAGTAVFIVDYTVDGWLVAKLTLVSLMAVAHTLAGLMILRAESGNGKPVVIWCRILRVVLCLLMAAIVWIVLAKPPVEELL